ncbi:MAG: anthranilate synthase component I family protein [Acidimicrobiia bacterium]
MGPVARLLAHLPPDVDAAAVRSGRQAIVGAVPAEVVGASGADAFARLDTLEPGWWAGFASYDLGQAVERIAARTGGGSDEPPDLLLARFPARAVVDLATGAVDVTGDGPGRPLLEDAARRAEPPLHRPVDATAIVAPRWGSSLDRSAFEASVGAILELIRAGDCYQVNLTRRLTGAVALDPVALFGALEARNPAPHAAFVRVGVARGRAPLAVVSASPECFLRWKDRDVETRPIKGTAHDAGALRASAKDRAENVMIVDLARNDLGRVCEPGSITVPSLCALETHPGLHHLVSTVRGRRRASIGIGALLRATFPPASVTGAPKPRVLQIIEDLEPVRRGVYCGAVGWIDTERDAGELAVAIRTFTVVPGATHLGVGAGIVADSNPAAEWAETELKAARLLACAADASRAPAHALAS